MEYESYSHDDTMRIASRIAGSAERGDIYCLSGELGAGKTVFAKGFAHGLGISYNVTSPTFTIINEYGGGRLPMYHFDVYRLGSACELEDAGYEEYFYGSGVCLVEWAELVADVIPDGAVSVRIEKDASRGDEYRRILVRRSADETAGD